MENTSETQGPVLKPIETPAQPEQQAVPAPTSPEQPIPTEPNKQKEISILRKIIESLKGGNRTTGTKPTESNPSVQTPTPEPVRTSPWVQRAEESGHAYNPDSKTLEEQWTGKK